MAVLIRSFPRPGFSPKVEQGVSVIAVLPLRTRLSWQQSTRMPLAGFVDEINRRGTSCGARLLHLVHSRARSPFDGISVRVGVLQHKAMQR
jgi:hypothetical protein